MRETTFLFAAAISGALAQSLSAYPADAPSSSPTPTTGPVYVTETISDCDSETPETMITVTDATTSYYCPLCEDMPHTTIYTTVYQSLCSTGATWSTTPVVHTITETCDSPEPTWTPGPDHIPQDYTVTVKQCDMCATPGPVTITEPCGCKASEGIPTGPAPTGAAPTGGSSPPSGSGSGSGSPGSGAGSPGSPGNAGSGSTPGGSPPGSGNRGGSYPGGESTPGQATPGQGYSAGAPYPTETATAMCPGPQCQHPAASGASAPTWGNTSNITPYPGSASVQNAAGLSTLFAIAIGVLAFLL